jgi:iron complex outermembrane receptor protein
MDGARGTSFADSRGDTPGVMMSVFRKTLVSSVALAVSAAVSAQAPAQQIDGDGEELVLGEVTVTGSRLRVRDGMETPTPVTAMVSEEIEALAPGNLVEALNQLPQFLNNSGPANVSSIGGAAGSSFLNLRGVGSNRTLVLLDGRRVASSTRAGVADVATFPESMIRGMEVVTGGASAAYGSDAVGGVVNFLLDTDYTGLKGKVQGGMTSRHDNENFEVSLSGGTQLGDRTHLLVSFDYLEANEIKNYKGRDWYKNWGTVDVNGRGQPTIIASDVRSRLYTAGGLIRLPGSALDMIHFTEGGIPQKFVDGTIVGATRQVGGTGFWGDIGSKEEDAGGQGSIYPENSRGSAFLYLDHEINDNWKGFVQYIRGQNNTEFNGSGAHQEEAWAMTIYQENPFIPQSIRDVMESEGITEFPLHRYSSSADLARNRVRQENTLNSYTAGVRGDIGETRVNAYYQYGRSRSLFKAIDFPRADRLYRAMDTMLDPDTGAIICRSTLTNPNDGCVPANPFGPGTMSREAIDYILEGDMYRNQLTQQHFVEVSADRQLGDLFGAGPMSVAGGVSYRKDKFSQVSGPDDLVALDVLPSDVEGYRGLPGNLVGSILLQFSGIDDAPVAGDFDVREVFGETLIPLLRGKPGIQALDGSASIRYADYSGSGGVLAWKLGLDWRINDSVRARVTRSRDTRAGTLSERYDVSTGGGTANDPVLGESYSFNLISGGNPNVDPELSDTWTVGLVFRPTALPGFAMSADWYDIKIKDYISQLGAQRIIDDCQAGAAALCDRVIRDPVTNRITAVENLFLNVAQARVKGVDFETSYRMPITLFGGGESLSLRLFASWLDENSQSNIGVPLRDSAGTTNLPEWTATGILSYENGPFRTSLTGRWIDERVQNSQPVALASQLDDDHVASVFYMNWRGEYEFGQARGGTRKVFLNIANLLDRDPPKQPNWSDFFGASSFIPGLHDALGRRYTLGVEFAF